MKSRSTSLLLSLAGIATLLSAAALPQPPAAAQEPARKTVIAHRGASGYLPEHTLSAYAAAHAQGADYIEPDVVLTKDGVLVCLHDLYLETTTDAAARFPDRKREDGHWYALDFTLEEIRTLRVFGRVPAAERDRLPFFRVPTLEELIQLVQHLNRTTGGECGLLVETKAPTSFHEKHGKPLEKTLLALLARYGYTGAASRAIIQSFEAPSQKKLRFELKTELPLIQLSGVPVSDEALKEIATYAVGFAPNRRAVVDAGGRPLNDNALVKNAHRHGLKVWVWTFNAEEAEMRRFLWELGVDGVITNHPDVGRRAAAPPPGRG
ncbi:MAG: glycerophosphodiester phosphodiesterase family protein [Armatimonadota bacterium]